MNKFLVVDDSATMRASVKSMLVRLGIREDAILMAEDGQKAIEVFKQEKPHVVLLDMEMPNLKGGDAADVMMQEQPDVKIIVLTGLERTDPEVRRIIQEGVYAYLQKPLRLTELKKIMTLLDMERTGAGRIT